MYTTNKKNKMNYLTLLSLSTIFLLTSCGGSGSSPAPLYYDDAVEIELTSDMLSKPRLAVGFNHSCFITADNGAVKCWGDNRQGQLGDNKKTQLELEDEYYALDPTSNEAKAILQQIINLGKSAPVTVIGIANAVEISAAENHTCALLEDKNVKCWGNNSKRQLGNTILNTQNKNASSTAVDVTSIQGLAVNSISVGSTYGCALIEGGDIKCWGSTPNGSSAADLLELTNKNPIHLATGSAHACAVLTGNQVQCWGDNKYSQLGHINNAAALVTGIDNALRVSSKSTHSCALLNTGRVKCWGYNESGQVGNGERDSKPVTIPALVGGLSKVISLSSGEQYNCAVTNEGQVLCWGNNLDSQLGFTSPAGAPDVRPLSPRPKIVVGLTTAKEVSVSQNHSCAFLSNAANEESVSCWGKNDLGQLGNRTQMNSATPVKVVF